MVNFQETVKREGKHALLFLITSLFFFTLSLVNPANTKACTVGACAISSAAGVARITATGCTPSDTIFFSVRNDPNQNAIDSLNVLVASNGTATGEFSGLSAGTYYLSAGAFGLSTTTYCSNFPVQVTGAPVGGIYLCGDDVASEIDICPSECPNSQKPAAPGGGSTGRWCACGTAGKGCCRTGNACQNDQMICTSGICRTIPSVGTVAEISEGCDATSINTAIGCIPFGSSSALVAFFVSWGLGISGGVAMLSLIYSAFMIMTSAGDPKKLASGQEYLVSSLSGIVLIAFSVFILRIIGIDILGLFV
jgi:hypothetical protein